MYDKSQLNNSKNLHLCMKYIDEYSPEVDPEEILKYLETSLY